MGRRRKRLSSEEPGVLFAEHNRGGSQRVIEALLRRPSSTICLELARGRQEDCSVARNQGGLFMISAVRDPDARASWPWVARCTGSFTITSFIAAGPPSRFRSDCGS